MGRCLVIYPGSFDPPTNGHLWAVQEASEMYEQVIWLLANNAEKQAVFTIEERLKLMKQLVEESGLQNVEVAHYPNFLIDYALSQKQKSGLKTIILRGFRNSTDIEEEMTLFNFNQTWGREITHIYLRSRGDLVLVSSTSVKRVVKAGEGWEDKVKFFVPDCVVEALKEKHQRGII